MFALLSSRHPAQLFRDCDLLRASPAVTFDTPATPLPAVAVPRSGVGPIACVCLVALGMHAAGFLWFRNSAPAQPLPPITRPMPIAMQMVAKPKPPPPMPAVEQPAAPPPVTPAPPPKPVATAPKAEAPRAQPAKPPAKPQPAQKPAVEKPAVEKQPPAAAPQSMPTQRPAPASPVSREPTTTAPIGRAGYLNNPPPVYPPAAAKRHQQGTTVLRVHVLANGRPDQVEVAQSSGFSALDDAARAAVRQWSFTPAKRGDSPVDGWVNVPLAFTLAP